jgi:hypothetical protein
VPRPALQREPAGRGSEPPRRDELDLFFALTMSQPTCQPSEWRHIDPTYAVKTWRYLRLAMVALVVGLGVSIAYERLKVHPGCFQASISAYYYTPVRGYFVGSLIGIAVSLLCLRGNTAGEDVLLNLAGMFASVVALVPTPDAGTCMSVPFAMEDRAANIANNVSALLAVGALALVMVAIMAVREPRTRTSIIASATAGLVWLAALLVFEIARHFFDNMAHYTAAVLMFACIIAVGVINAAEYKKHKSGSVLRNPYTAVAAGMGMAIVVSGGARWVLGWRHWTIAIETALIALFAIFWAVQTKELWDDGLRVRTR